MKNELINILIVGLGGFVGTICRYLISRLFIFFDLLSFPFATLSVNILGSFLIGFLIEIFSDSNNIQYKLMLFLTVGFCGGFTTFSTFSFDNLQLIRDGEISSAVLNISLSLILGVFAVLVGYFLAKKIVA